MAVTDRKYMRMALSPKAGPGAESIENLNETIDWIKENSRCFTGNHS